MTPDGRDPAAYGQLLFYPIWGQIPRPAPYRGDRDYSSDPDWATYVAKDIGLDPKLFEWDWNPASYQHDVCYGNQEGRLYCDVKFWDRLSQNCTFGFSTRRANCYLLAGAWYTAVRAFGGPAYKPRQSSLEPAGVPWS